jgi:hypothetical protein
MLIASGVKYLAKVKTLSGPAKKDLVLRALRETVQYSSWIKESEKAEIITAIDTFGDGLVEHLVQFASDGYTFIKEKLKAKGWCNCNRVETVDRSTVFTQIRNSGEYTTLKDYLILKLQRPITAPKIITAVAAGVKYIERYRNISGAEKKYIVIHAIRDIILESDFIHKAELLNVVDTFADDTVDYLVDFGKNMYLKIKKGCCRGKC